MAEKKRTPPRRTRQATPDSGQPDTEQVTSQEVEATAPQKKGFGSFEGKDGYNYHLQIGKLIYKRKLYTAEEIIADPELREALVEIAWKGPDGRREEDQFERNGVLRIEY